MALHVNHQQALEVIGRMTGRPYRPRPTQVQGILDRLAASNPLRFEFEMQRLQGRAWDHDEVPDGQEAQAQFDPPPQQRGEGAENTEVPPAS